MMSLSEPVCVDNKLVERRAARAGFIPTRRCRFCQSPIIMFRAHTGCAAAKCTRVHAQPPPSHAPRRRSLEVLLRHAHAMLTVNNRLELLPCDALYQQQ